MRIGEYIMQLRGNTSQEALGRGLCSDVTISNIESGKHTPDKLLADILLQRLGKSPDKLEMNLPSGIFEKVMQRDELESLVEEGNKEEAYTKLEKYMTSLGTHEKIPLHEMYYFRSRAYIVYRIEHNMALTQELIEKAIDITLPENWRSSLDGDFLISAYEIENLLAYARVRLERAASVEELHEVRCFLDRCQECIDKNVTDKVAHAKLYAKCMWLLARGYRSAGIENRRKTVELCEAGLTELRREGISYFMLPLLDILTECGERYLEESVYRMYCNSRRILSQWWCDFGLSRHFTDSMFHNSYTMGYYLQREAIRGERLAKGYSQDKLAELCGENMSVKTISLTENGRTSLTKALSSKIINILGISRDRYDGFVITDDFDLLELYKEIMKQVAHREYDAAKEMIKHLKERLNLSNPENARVVRNLDTMMLIAEGCATEDMLEYEKKLLAQTYTFDKNGKAFRPPFYQEAITINVIAVLYLELAEDAKIKGDEARCKELRNKAWKLYQAAVESMRKSALAPKFRTNSYCLLVSCMVSERPSADAAFENMRFILECGSLNLLPYNNLTAACNLIDEPNNRQRCKQMISDTCYMYELAMNLQDKKIASDYYERKFNSKID